MGEFLVEIIRRIALAALIFGIVIGALAMWLLPMVWRWL
jgi:hypothetical protein